MVAYSQKKREEMEYFITEKFTDKQHILNHINSIHAVLKINHVQAGESMREISY